jgi:hypothetical protein
MENAIVVKGTLIDGMNILLKESINSFYGEEIEIIIRPIQQKKKDIVNDIKQVLESYKGVIPFKDIQDPVQWQRQIRSEWDR